MQTVVAILPMPRLALTLLPPSPTGRQRAADAATDGTRLTMRPDTSQKMIECRTETLSSADSSDCSVERVRPHAANRRNSRRKAAKRAPRGTAAPASSAGPAASPAGRAGAPLGAPARAPGAACPEAVLTAGCDDADGAPAVCSLASSQPLHPAVPGLGPGLGCAPVAAGTAGGWGAAGAAGAAGAGSGLGLAAGSSCSSAAAASASSSCQTCSCSCACDSACHAMIGIVMP